MAAGAKTGADRFVLIACGVGALLMTALTAGAADTRYGPTDHPYSGAGVLWVLVLLGLLPYGLTALLSAIRPLRRFVVATTRAVAVIYGLFDCGIRYGALYHPQSSTDAVVVAILPFWWLPILVVVAAVTAVTLWVVSRVTGRPALA